MEKLPVFHVKIHKSLFWGQNAIESTGISTFAVLHHSKTQDIIRDAHLKISGGKYMANNELKTEELDKVLDGVSSEEQLQEYLDCYTNKEGYGFCQYFNEYLAEHDVVHAEVIADSNLDKDYATQITNGTRRNPGRDKALALCIAAGMKKDEINRALKLLNISPLYSRNKRDSVLLLCINKEIRKVIYINLELERLGFPILR